MIPQVLCSASYLEERQGQLPEAVRQPLLQVQVLRREAATASSRAKL